jgi:diguanylate cyclase (GGDEF)-like protein/PAS domain S-box-containing protein
MQIPNDILSGRVHLDQIRMVYSNTPLALFTSLLNSFILVYLLWPQFDRVTLIAWLLMICLITVPRFYFSIRFKQIDPEENSVERWANRALAGALLAGLGWGAASYFLFASESLPHQVFLAFVIAGTAAGAVTTLSAQRSAIIGFILLATLPLSYRFFLADHDFNLAMSMMTILFAMLTIVIAFQFHHNLTEMLIERHRRIKTQQRERSRTQVLEMLSNGDSLNEILETIIKEVESENPEMLCAILLVDLDEYKKSLVCGAMSSLPGTLDLYENGMEIGDSEACSGAAAYTGKRIIVEDMLTHPNWCRFRDTVVKSGLRSCWSEPVFSSGGRLLGTFSVYHRIPHVPNNQEFHVVEEAIKLIAISIEQNRSTEALRLAASIYENTSEAMMITDEENNILAINPAFTEVTKYEAEEVIGKDPGMLASETHDEAFFKELWGTLNTTGEWRGEIWNRRKNGDEFVEWLTINTIYDANGKVHRRVSLFSDITERKKADAMIWRQANYDTLTQLPNRRLFQDRLEQGIKVASREKVKLALLFIDLDRFKEVNDTLGHHMGDQLLVEASQRISSCIRETDTVARLGGDEFTVILNELHDLSHIGVVSHKIIESVAKPFKLQGKHLFISASVGVTVYPEDAVSAEELLKNADQAMFAAKQNGRNRVNYFTKSMQDSAQHRMRLICDIHQALKKDQFSVYYQPIVSLASGRIQKAEALLRWKHPERGFISPAEFIPVAEDTGAIHEIGNIVFMEAAQQVKVWRANYDPEFQISINKSPVQFLAEGVVKDDWLVYLTRNNISPRGIVIEITEGVLLQAASNIDEKLCQLREAEIEVAIDDFGTGYSSLAYLKRFDIDYLKLDKSFVSNLETDADDLALSEAIIMMAHKLGIRVVAEGVEAQAQREILEKISCDYAQGYLYARPIQADEFEALLQKESAPISFA